MIGISHALAVVALPTLGLRKNGTKNEYMPYFHHSFDFTKTDDIDGFTSLSLYRSK